MTTLHLSIVIRTNEELSSFLLSDELHLVSALTIENIAIDNVDFLSKCVQLKKLILYDLPYVSSIRELPSSLVELRIISLLISNVDFLSNCIQLKKLLLSLLKNLTHISYLPSSLVRLSTYLPISYFDIANKCPQIMLCDDTNSFEEGELVQLISIKTLPLSDSFFEKNEF